MANAEDVRAMAAAKMVIRYFRDSGAPDADPKETLITAALLVSTYAFAANRTVAEILPGFGELAKAFERMAARGAALKEAQAAAAAYSNDKPEQGS